MYKSQGEIHDVERKFENVEESYIYWNANFSVEYQGILTENDGILRRIKINVLVFQSVQALLIGENCLHRSNTLWSKCRD